VSIGVSIDLRDTARPTLTGLRTFLGSSVINDMVARAAVNRYKGHLEALDAARPNALGGQRRHFYAEASGNTSFRVEADGVTISIASDGIAQRYFGGTIVPKRRKFLTIPVHPLVYGKTAREFAGKLKVRFGRGRVPVALVMKESGVTMYLLRRSITQAGDPTVLPAPESVTSAVVESLERELAAQIRRGGAR
jgi:hypothetical protein